jgi:hypothetical protein
LGNKLNLGWGRAGRETGQAKMLWRILHIEMIAIRCVLQSKNSFIHFRRSIISVNTVDFKKIKHENNINVYLFVRSAKISQGRKIHFFIQYFCFMVM